MLKIHKIVYRTNANDVNLNDWTLIGTNKNKVSFYAGLVEHNQVQIIVLDKNKIQFYPRYFVDTLINADTSNGMELESYVPSWTLNKNEFDKLQKLLKESAN